MTTKKITAKAAAGMVEEATVLNREVKESNGRMTVLKVGIRAYAVEVDARRDAEERGTKVEIASEEGTATVSFTTSEVSLVKGANPRVLREVLPAATWSHLFEERVVLKDGFDDAFKLLSKAEQAEVRKMVEWNQPEPRVLLPK